MTTLYGISNCDTVRKTRKWLETNSQAYEFHDFRKDGLQRAQVDRWCDALGLETVLNKRGTTWRALPAEQRDNLDEDGLRALLVEQPTLIKRPVLEHNGEIRIGFKADDYAALFGVA
ncbi:ArsC family reductase [Marinobacterium sp. D7]|uniref:ArsC family reductase n=1 Tax=Marinobacterium ramblicola TaxID=2849041 RepID=UPI001C2D7236|nr:ArsC family reductase [Marinobacterium ramblicola]MBV1789772.1 ArsC family reductase [Marinobacterium ramblicola]